MKSQFLKIKFIIVFTFLIPVFSLGQSDTCTSESAGKERFAGSRLTFCNGSNWIPMGKLTSTPCDQVGKTVLSGNDLLYCDGSFQLSHSCLVTAAPCSGALGTKRFSAGELQFCDGTNWVNMSGGGCSTTNDCSQQIFSMVCDGSSGPGGTATYTLPPALLGAVISAKKGSGLQVTCGGAATAVEGSFGAICKATGWYASGTCHCQND